MPSTKPSLVGKLIDLREVTRLTGTLDELQVHNLQMWGRIAFPQVKKFGLTWDGAQRIVEYDLQSQGASIEYHDFDRRMEAMNTSVKEMLGDEWVFLVKLDGKTWFTGPRKMPFKAASEKLSLAPERGEMKDDARGKGNS